ncbi:phage tail protein [candidate division LCP-89 bacterium B3_LCP]|uniref:Phage tail protein n=1 Tax=candidate division LCP-89 bacterium B3_LCP TaxID=2012998 RepID=A0A532UUA2_UNCL8|nr:MAG: phage tail protein [candidate division LCP-89 bacterium B3_LCP]
MPTYLHPGVYVEEIPSGVKPIEGVATSIAAFIGEVYKGPANEAVLIHSWDDYVTEFCDITSEEDKMGLAVSAFYQNGGKDAYIVRLVNNGVKASLPTPPGTPGESTGGADVFVIEASSVGTWGNDTYVRIVKPNTTDLTFDLEVGHIEDGEFEADEVFSDLSMDNTLDSYVLTIVNRDSSLISISLTDIANPDKTGNLYKAGSLTSGVAMTTATYFQNNIANNMTLSLNINNLGRKRITLGEASSFSFTGTPDNDADGKILAAAIQKAVLELDPTNPPYKNFTCVYNDTAAPNKFILSSGTAMPNSTVSVYDGDESSTDLANVIKLSSKHSPESVHGSEDVIPKEQLGVAELGIPLEGGSGDPPTANDYKNFFDPTLKKIRDISIMVLPGQYWAANGSGNAAISNALTHADVMKNRMVIIDPEPGTDGELDQAKKVTDMELNTSTYGVLYYPWVKVANPFYHAETNPNVSKTLTIAPSAFAAGMWSKVDGKRGVWKAPAGMDTSLLGVAGLEYIVGDGEQDQLNPMGVNCLRKMPGYGTVIWGTRTLSTKANPEWRYIPIRRTAIYIEQSIYNGIQWAVFEPNCHILWSSLRTNITSFMNGMFRNGAFQGEKASDAYFVRCDLGDTMTQDDIDRGQVIVIVGFAPLKPAEFVIVRIQQKVAQQ